MRRGGLVLVAALVALALVASYVAYAAISTGGFGAGETTGERAENGWEDTAPEKADNAPLSKKASFDPRDERQVVGGSDDVFFGRVLERTGSEKAPPVGSREFQEPQTQYAVEVTQAIKGELSGTIVLNRRGGSPAAPDVPGGGSYLEEGREYLFATKYVEAKGWHQVVLPGAGVAEIEDEAHREEIEQRYEEAFANQTEVNMPLPPATPEEVEERSYRPCWPDGSTPTGWDHPCDPSDPLPAAAKEEGFMDKVKSSGRTK